MRVVVIGDLHLDARVAGWEYCDDVRRILHDVAESIAPGDVVVQLGDVCDPDNGARTWRALDVMRDWIEELERAEVGRVYLLVGNHDRIDDVRASSSIASLALSRSVDVVDTIGSRMLCDAKGCRLIGLFVPWLSRAHGEFDVEEQCCGIIDIADDERFLIFCHQDITGAVPGSESDLPRLGRQFLPQSIIDDPRVERVFAGHIHNPASIGKVEIVGSLACLGMGERDANERRGWIELEIP